MAGPAGRVGREGEGAGGGAGHPPLPRGARRHTGLDEGKGGNNSLVVDTIQAWMREKVGTSCRHCTGVDEGTGGL